VGITVIERVKIQAQVLVPLVKALQAELGEERANALVRKTLGDIFASKLRLAPQSRIGPRTAGRRHDGHRPSAYDTAGFDREFFEDGWPR
jgi:hypothetical protein